MPRLLGRKTIRYDSVTSTNEVLKALALEGIETGTLVTAKVQTHGRGRLERRWESPEGGLWMSVLFEMPPGFDSSRYGLLPLMAGASVATAILMEHGLDAGVKWPNDVLIAGRKACGILGEIFTVGDRHLAIIGIGINVNNRVQVGYDFSSGTTSIAEEFGKSVKTEVLENTVLEELEFRHDLLVSGEYDKILEDWRELSVTLGRKVHIVMPGGEMTGIARDIDPTGALLVEMDDVIHKVNAGDCRHLE